MSDPLKSFLQRHRAQLDRHEAPAGLFEKVFSELTKKQFGRRPTNHNNNNKKYLRAAAALILILSGTVLRIYKSDAGAELPCPNLAATARYWEETDDPCVESKPAVEPHAPWGGSCIHHNPVMAMPTRGNPGIAQGSPQTNQNTAPVALKSEESASRQGIDPPSMELEQTASVLTVGPENQEAELLAEKAEVIIPLTSVLAEEPESQSQSGFGGQWLESTGSNGLLNLFSKKLKEWSNHRIQLEEQEYDEASYLTFQIRTSVFELEKSFRINSP